MKPYAVKVTIGEKVSGKEFDSKKELDAFLKKAEELKKKAPMLKVEIIRDGLPKKSPPTVEEKIIYDDRKEESPAWKRIIIGGKPVVVDGKQLYGSLPMPEKKGHFYCPYCCSYKPLKQKVDLGYGLMEDGCPDCGITFNDFHMKRVNPKLGVK